MKELSLFPDLPSPSMWFDGETYDSGLDETRLSKQIFVVWRKMNDGMWHTLHELSERTGFPEASISARIRDFRKERFGSHDVIRERGVRGLWRYKLVPLIPMVAEPLRPSTTYHRVSEPLDLGGGASYAIPSFAEDPTT